ncbi:MAG: ABC transporter permease [Sulfolobales archaeon]
MVSGFKMFIIRRIILYTALFFSVIIVTFLLIHLAPGDPTYILAGQVTDPEFIKAVRHRFGLDKPLYEQLIIYIENVLRGDLGYSYFRSEPVTKLILERLPATFLLVLTSMFIASLIGVLLGTLAAAKRGVVDSIISILSLLGISIPYFWLGQLMLIIFSMDLGWFPTGGMISLTTTYTGIYYYLDVLYHLVLPATTLAIFNIAYITRVTRGSVLETMSQDFIITARAKGLPERRVIFRHALRNALIPVVTFIGFNTGVLLVGAIVTETIFAWPGMGSLLYSSLQLRDYPVLLGIFIYGALIVITINLIVDILYGLLDPRIKRE